MEHTFIEKLLESSSGMMISVSLRDLKAWHNWVMHTIQMEAKNNTITTDEQFLSPMHTRKMLDISTMQLHRWKKANYLVPTRIGDTDKYRLSDIKRIIEQGYERHEINKKTGK